MNLSAVDFHQPPETTVRAFPSAAVCPGWISMVSTQTWDRLIRIPKFEFFKNPYGKFGKSETKCWWLRWCHTHPAERRTDGSRAKSQNKNLSNKNLSSKSLRDETARALRVLEPKANRTNLISR